MGHDWFMLHLSVARERWSTLSKPIHNCWQRLLLFLFYFWNKELENFLPKYILYISLLQIQLFFSQYLYFSNSSLDPRTLYTICISYLSSIMQFIISIIFLNHYNNSFLFLSLYLSIIFSQKSNSSATWPHPTWHS